MSLFRATSRNLPAQFSRLFVAFLPVVEKGKWKKSVDSLGPLYGELFDRNCVAHLSNSFSRFIYGSYKFLPFCSPELILGIWKWEYSRLGGVSTRIPKCDCTITLRLGFADSALCKHGIGSFSIQSSNYLYWLWWLRFLFFRSMGMRVDDV